MDSALKFYEKVEQFPEVERLSLRRLQGRGGATSNLGGLQDGARDLRGRRAHDPRGARSTSTRQQKEALQKEAKKDNRQGPTRHVGGPDKAWEFLPRRTGRRLSRRR